MISTESVSAAVAIPAKIQPHHLERLSVVYVRQSTAQQVLNHRESTALQYNLRQRAMAWGWAEDRVLVIDDDQGHTASTIEGREGFQRLLAEVSLNHVGLVLGIEMSRLARSCKDWHQLLELCALFNTLLADQDGLYDPRQYNDRLLLGMKGTLSEAELHVLQQRMHQGRMNKARRGELFNHVPIGYVRTPGNGELAIDPDQQVQEVVRLIFAQFGCLGTINAVLQYLVKHQIRVPVRAHAGPQRGQLQWRRPNRQTVYNLLHHPIYAGAYTWGRRAVDPRKKIPGRPNTGRTVVPPEQCQVLIKDRWPAYINWSQYQANRRQLAANQARAPKPGPVREGAALLSGLLVCGCCGHHMSVCYDQAGRVRYVCLRQKTDYGGPRCQSLAGQPVEQWVVQQVLTVLQPARLALSLRAGEDLQQERQQLDQHWQMRLQRTRYDAERAARQYHAVEPENRLVARELESQWEQKLQDHRQLQEEYDRFQQTQATALHAQDQQMIEQLASDIPALWHSPRTTVAQRQTVIRYLVEQVTVHAPSSSNHADATIRWAGGFTSQRRLRRPVGRYDQLDDYPQLLQYVLELHAQQVCSRQIAEQLNSLGFRPPKRCDSFNSSMVRSLICRHRPGVRQKRRQPPTKLSADEWRLADLAEHLAMPKYTLYRWVRLGWVHAHKQDLPGHAGGQWILWADAGEIERLTRLRKAPRTWHNQLQAANLTQPKPRGDLSANL